MDTRARLLITSRTAALIGLAFALLTLMTTDPARAGRYTQIAEAPTLAGGTGEIIQAAAYSRIQTESEGAQAVDLEYGFEFGLTDALQVGLALPALSVAWQGEHRETGWSGITAWGLFNLSNPESAPVGLTLAVVGAGDGDYRSLEAGVILEKALGNWIVNYNTLVGYAGARHAGVSHERVVSQALGASFAAWSWLAVGCELIHSLTWLDVARHEPACLHGGPNLAMDFGRLWITMTPLLHLRRVSGEPEFSLQTQIGMPF